MKKLSFLLLASLLMSFSGKAQYLQNFTGDNYSGINGALLQPASIVDSRFKFDIMFYGYQTGVSSNYAAFNANVLADAGGGSTQLKYYRKSTGKSYYNRNKENQYLCFMFNITPNDAVGFVKRSRTITNIDGLDQDMALLLYSDMNNTSLNNNLITNKNLSYQYMKFRETDFSYAHVLQNKGDRFIKVGGTMKVLNGIEALALYSKNAQITPIDGSNAQFTNTDFTYGYSRNTSKGFNNHLSLGLDLGVVYEYRPAHSTYFYDMDNQKNLPRKDLNKYKFRFGASILDLGRIKFTKTDSSGNFTANQNINGFAALNANNPQNANYYIASQNFPNASSNKNTFSMNLPTALSLQADYYFKHDIYFGYTSYIPIWLRSDPAKVHNTMVNVITARYEKRSYGVAIPVTLQRNGRVEAGLNVRVGPITIGTTNLSSYLIGQRKLYDLNFYFSMRMFRLHPAPADKDGDKVSDKKDYCPTEPGTWALQGCPDKDEDGLPDYKDYCPNAAGPLNLNGCPDTDGDGVLDYMDACPTEKGYAINKGCPDRDKDGIIDIADRCPDVPGVQKNNGCPEEPIVCCADSDGDGILDRFDDCPTEFGTLINKGCPAHTTGNDSQTRINDANEKKQEAKKQDDKKVDDKKTEDKKPEIMTDNKVAPANNDNGNVSKPQNTNASEKPIDKSGKEKQTGKNSGKSAKGETNTVKTIVHDTVIIHDTLVKPIVDRVPTDPVPVYKTVPIDPKNAKGKTTNRGKNKGKNHVPEMDISTVMDEPNVTVYFDKDSYVVLPKYKRELDQIVKQMLANKTAKLVLQGHTDNDGDDDYNNTLSYNRTMAVEEYIILKGRGHIDRKRVEILYFGEKKPVIENTDEKKKQINRRVEIKLIP